MAGGGLQGVVRHAVLPVAAKGLRWIFSDLRWLIGIGFAALGVQVAYLQYKGTPAEKRKALTFVHMGSTPLAMLLDDAGGKLAITYDGKPVVRPVNVTGRLLNSGDIPILPSEVEEPVFLPLGGSRVLQSSVLATNRPRISARVRPGGGGIFVDFGLLNPGDSIDLVVLCDGVPDAIRPTCRIAGLPEIGSAEPEAVDEALRSRNFRRWLGRLFLTGGLTGWALVVMVFYAYRVFRYGPRSYREKYIVLMTFIYIVIAHTLLVIWLF